MVVVLDVVLELDVVMVLDKEVLIEDEETEVLEPIVVVIVVSPAQSFGWLRQHIPPGHKPSGVRVKQQGGVSPSRHVVSSSTHSAQQFG